MNEVALPNDLGLIEVKIRHHMDSIGSSIWEIGNYLSHVKTHDLAHGEFRTWHERIGISKDFASKSMKIAEQLPNVETLRHLGTSALYLIATLPDEAQAEQLERIEQGDSPTVRELQEVKRQLQLQKQLTSDLTDENSRLKSATVEVREVIREVVPADYSEALRLSQSLQERTKAAEERNAFLESRLSQLSEQREKAQMLDDMEQVIKRGNLTEEQRSLASVKDTIEFLRKANRFLSSFGGIAYLDIQKILLANAQLNGEMLVLSHKLEELLMTVKAMLGQAQPDIIDGVFLDKEREV